MKSLNNEYITNMSVSFDKAINENDGGTLLQLVKATEEKNIEEFSDIELAQLFYSLGTAYSELKRLDKIDYSMSVEKQLFYYRKAIDVLHFEKNDSMKLWDDLKRKLYTNYGNCLDEIGRKQPALEAYYSALEVSPTFGMTLGEIGVALSHYYLIDYDTNHKNIYAYFAYRYLSVAVQKYNKDIHPSALAVFQKYLGQYNYEEESDIEFKQFNYKGEELQYRKWGLNNRLFLNPLNDLPVSEMAFAADIIQLPDMIADINAKPIFHGLFNQIKQEYIYARYLYYKSIQISEKPHFADKETYLLQFADYPQYSIRIENMKSAFRTLYSLLDKVAYFLNKYFDLGIDECKVNFRYIWNPNSTNEKHDTSKNKLNPSKNYALNALYWISKDFTEKYENSPNPYAKHLSIIRNALEHKYLKVFDDSFIDRSDGSVDDWALYVSERNLSKYTIQLLKLIREVILNLSFAVYQEEKSRFLKNKDNTIVMPIMMLNYDDEWKI